MFGWLKSLFGAEPVQETVVPPPLPKVKKVSKKAEKKPATKKTAVKTAKAKDSKKKEAEVITLTVDPSPVADPSPKKKGGRPRKIV